VGGTRPTVRMHAMATNTAKWRWYARHDGRRAAYNAQKSTVVRFCRSAVMSDCSNHRGCHER
ncbi:MAG: hypothetical protein ACOVOI_15415, partial [Hyphomicrobiales bacterium]